MKTLIFDFNDTISPSNFIQTIRKYESVIGYRADEFVKKYIDAGLLSKLLEGGYDSEVSFWSDVSLLTGVDIDILLKIRRDIAESKIIDENMLTLIKELGGKHKLALVTDNVLETFDYWVEKFKLNSVFDLIVNSARYGIMKSDVRLYQLTLSKLQSLPRDTILIDDYEANLELVAKIGMRTILFRDVVGLKKSLSELGVEMN